MEILSFNVRALERKETEETYIILFIRNFVIEPIKTIRESENVQQVERLVHD